MKKYNYKNIGKPLPPHKQKALFEMFDAWMNASNDCKIGNEDWEILGEQCGEITVMNKHTFENFNFLILESLGYSAE